MKIYVAGPMRGIPYFNEPAFRLISEALRSMGHEVFNPMEKDIEMYGHDVYNSPTGDLADLVGIKFDHREAMLIDITWIAHEADAVCTLGGWENSRGASAEVAFGRAIGIPTEGFLWFRHTAWYKDV